MSHSIKALCALGLLVVVAACSARQHSTETVYVEPAPLSTEPVFTGKYGN